VNISHHYRAFPRQEQFHNSTAKYRLFGGAAGPGKTKALLWEAIGQALETDGCDTLLLRRTYPELEASLLAQFRRDVPATFYKSYNESKHLVTWNNGSTTIDELTHFTLKQWQFLTSRNRCPLGLISGGANAGRTPFACMAGASNPGNIGHAWVKGLWVDHVPPAGYDRPELYDARDYDFIRARLEDNPIYANDIEYRRTLEALPEHLRRAFLDGDWNVFAGQYFDVFEIGRHTARLEDFRLEAWCPRWISVDWGFQHNSAVYWHCAMPAPDGHGARIVTYREFVQSGLSPRMLGQAIAERSGRENISEVFLSPDAFAHRTAEASIAEQLGEIFTMNGLPRPAPADDDRIGGWQLMYQLLESESWVIADTCRELIECLPQLVRDERRSEDIRKVDGDDPADAARYGLVSGGRFAGVGAGFAQPRAGQSPPNSFGQFANPAGHFAGKSGGAQGRAGAFGTGGPFGGPGAHFPAAESGPRFVHGMPLGEQIARQITATDPTSQAIHFQRLEAEARKQFRPRRFPGRR
jgi:hypothetical protein